MNHEVKNIQCEIFANVGQYVQRYAYIKVSVIQKLLLMPIYSEKQTVGQ